MKTLIVNSDDLTGSVYNDTYKYTFPAGSVQFKDDSIALVNLSIYYSWFNITSSSTGGRYNNNSFQYRWYNNAGNAVFTVTMPDGNYGIESLNAYLQSKMIANGHYLINSSGDYVYYMELKSNSTYYSCDFFSYPVPTSLPVGWSNPAGLTFPIIASTPQLIISSSNNFNKIIGFNAGTYPSVNQTSNYAVSSTKAPQVSPVSSIIVTCNAINNTYSSPSTVLYSFSPSSVEFGSIIQVSPPELSFIDLLDGIYNDITFQFFDQSFNRIAINDSQILMLFNIRNKNDYQIMDHRNLKYTN